ncbi:MFS transporter [uncultured Maribacter sp.]|uniref:MFS transporter n=1 Tax=uncultured Maribacter sp. TaxID=431308 RepID=UPI0026165F0B|nr:MFS transporter [uncultured Maribacter sp.]
MNTKNSTGSIRKRFNVLTLVFISVVINYIDRSNISVAAFALSQDLSLSSIQMGYIFSAFAWTYAIFQIPGGILVDNIKARILYPIMLILWSISSLLQGFINSFTALAGLRASSGIFQAPSFPTNNAIASKWFPEKERASAIAIYTSGQYVGLAFLTPLLVSVQYYLGWRGLFIFSGIIGLILSYIWYKFYRDPKDHESISKTELEYICQDEPNTISTNESEDAIKFSWKDIKHAFVHKKLWGLYIGQFCIGSLIIFFLTWFPTYLVQYRGIDFLESGFLASIPFLAAFVGVILSGFTSDFLIRKGYKKEVARKLPIICGMLLSTCIIGVNYTDNTNFIILFLTIAFFGNGFASTTWVFVSLMAPKKLIGLVGGTFNFIGSSSAVITPIAIGYLAKNGDFRPAIFFITCLTFVGLLSFIFLVGKIKRINI